MLKPVHVPLRYSQLLHLIILCLHLCIYLSSPFDHFFLVSAFVNNRLIPCKTWIDISGIHCFWVCPALRALLEHAGLDFKELGALSSSWIQAGFRVSGLSQQICLHMRILGSFKCTLKKITLSLLEKFYFLCKLLSWTDLPPATAAEALQEELTMNQIVKRQWERWLDGVRQVPGTQ